MGITDIVKAISFMKIKELKRLKNLNELKRLKGSFTLEATVIFPLITVIIVGVIILDFTLHDRLLNDAGKILGAVRYHEAESFYYDAVFERIRLQKIAGSPVLGEDKAFAGKQRIAISRKSEDYYLQNKIGAEPQFTATDIRDVLDINDNAGVVRAGGRLVQIMGTLSDADNQYSGKESGGE